MIRSIVVAVLVAVAVVGGARLAAALVAADVNVVRVEGELTAAERTEVRGAVAEQLAAAGGRSVSEVVDVVARLAWVREVRARRHWPDALHIVVTRQTPAARWGRDGWLSTSGSIVADDPVGADPALATLPVIHAARTDGVGAMEAFNRVSAAAASYGLRVVALTESGAGDWTAALSDGVEVVLGRTQLRERMARFAIVHRAHLGPDLGRAETGQAVRRPDGAARADARYPNGVAVRWVPPAGEPATPATAVAPVLAAATPIAAAPSDAQAALGE